MAADKAEKKEEFKAPAGSDIVVLGYDEHSEHISRDKLGNIN